MHEITFENIHKLLFSLKFHIILTKHMLFFNSTFVCKLKSSIWINTRFRYQYTLSTLINWRKIVDENWFRPGSEVNECQQSHTKSLKNVKHWSKKFNCKWDNIINICENIYTNHNIQLRFSKIYSTIKLSFTCIQRATAGGCLLLFYKF